MKIRARILHHWPEVRSHFPADLDLDATARARGAFTRAREIKSAETLLRLALAYGGCGMSLHETCAWGAIAGIAKLADPSLVERLVKAAPWLGDIARALIAERSNALAGCWTGYRLRTILGTSISRPGVGRATWRLHVGFDLATGQVDRLELTTAQEPRSLRHLARAPGDIVLADPSHAIRRDLRPMIDAGARFIVRARRGSLRVLRPVGDRVDLFAALAGLARQEDEVQVRIDRGTAGLSISEESPALRLVMLRNESEPAQVLANTVNRCDRHPGPHGHNVASYALLLTSLPADVFSTADVRALYRFHGQIESAIKRMRRLAGVVGLPARNPDLARSWMSARLIVALLAEDIIPADRHQAEIIRP